MKLINLKFPFFLTVLAVGLFGLFSFSVPIINKLGIVVLDAGHGGKDPGTGNGKEKNMRLILLF